MLQNIVQCFTISGQSPFRSAIKRIPLFDQLHHTLPHFTEISRRTFDLSICKSELDHEFIDHHAQGLSFVFLRKVSEILFHIIRSFRIDNPFHIYILGKTRLRIDSTQAFRKQFIHLSALLYRRTMGPCQNIPQNILIIIT